MHELIKERSGIGLTTIKEEKAEITQWMPWVGTHKAIEEENVPKLGPSKRKQPKKEILTTKVRSCLRIE